MQIDNLVHPMQNEYMKKMKFCTAKLKYIPRKKNIRNAYIVENIIVVHIGFPSIGEERNC